MSIASTTLITASQLGQLLYSSRKARGLSQASLANQLGFSQSRVSHLEQHADQLSVAQLLAWCAALDLRLTLGAKGDYSVREDRGAEW